MTYCIVIIETLKYLEHLLLFSTPSYDTFFLKVSYAIKLLTIFYYISGSYKLACTFSGNGNSETLVSTGSLILYGDVILTKITPDTFNIGHVTSVSIAQVTPLYTNIYINILSFSIFLSIFSLSHLCQTSDED